MPGTLRHSVRGVPTDYQVHVCHSWLSGSGAGPWGKTTSNETKWGTRVRGDDLTRVNPRADQGGCSTLAFLIFPRTLAPVQTLETLAKSPLLPSLSPIPAHSVHRGMGKPGIFLGELQTPHWGGPGVCLWGQ